MRRTKNYCNNWKEMLTSFKDEIGKLSFLGHCLLLVLFPLACLACLIGLEPED